MTARLRLSPNDAMWLNMDSPENLMVIESIMWLDGAPEVDDVLDTLRTRLVSRYPVFTWRPESSAIGLDHWVEDPDFTVERHLSVHDLPAGGDAALARFVEEQMSVPLPRDRPLWAAHLLRGPDVAALMMRFHHAIADGTALVRVLLDMTTEPPGDISEPAAGSEDGSAQPWGRELDPAVWRSAATVHPDGSSAPAEPPTRSAPAESGELPVPNAQPPHSGPSGRERAGRALGALVTLPLAAGVTATTATAGLVHRLDPDHEGSLARRLADQALGTADAVDKLLVGNHPDVLLYGAPGRAKRAGWADPVALRDIKAVARAQGATVNDVMLAVLAGTLHRYLIGRGQVPQDVVTMIPVNLRPWDQPLPEHLGNRFALVALELPLAAPTPLERLSTAKARMDVVKRGPEALLTFGLSHAIGSVGAVTATASRRMVEFFGNKAIGVTTNVPGPTSVRYFAGRELTGVLGWVPGASRQTLGSCIFSYNGQVRVGFKADATVIPDMEALVAAFHDELADLIADGSAIRSANDEHHAGSGA